MIQSDQISTGIYRKNEIENIKSTFSNIQQSNFGYGAAINAEIKQGSSIKIQDCQFFQCKGTRISGGAISLNINNGGQVTISNSSFDQCEASVGGGIYASIQTSGKLTIDVYCNFTECKASGSGGGIYAQIYGINSLLTLEDGLKFEGCTFDNINNGNGKGVYIYLGDQASCIINKVLLFNQNDTYAGVSVHFFGVDDIYQKFNGTQFVNCDAIWNGGGLFAEIYSENSIFELISTIFVNCSAYDGGGIYSIINDGGQINIINQCIFTECKSTQFHGGGIYSEIIDGTLNIEDTTFDRCTCTQPGNGGGIALIQGSSSIISITDSSFINCRTISNSSDQKYGWGGAIFINTQVIATQLSQSNFQLRDLVFSGCSAVNSIGNNLHIQSDNTLATGLAIKNENLLTVKDLSNPPNIISDLYTSSSYAYDFMGINQSIESDNPGTINLDLHNPLFEQLFTSNVPNPTYIDSINGKDIKYCGGIQTMCKTMKYSINRDPIPFSETPPPDTNYSIILISNTELDTNIQITSTTLLNRQIIIQSDGYSPEVEEDNYTKYSIITSLFSTSLFTITQTGRLSLLGLRFYNLNPSATAPLILLRSDNNNQIPRLTIIDCEFNQDQTPDPIPYLSHSIISIVGGINEIEIIQSTISNISLSGSGNGAAINDQLQTGSFLMINDSEFIQCKGSEIYGGAIYLSINNDGNVTISNSSFYQCEAIDGGGIFAHVYSGGKLTIDGQCDFTECKSSYNGGGGISSSITGLNSQLIIDDGVKFEDCIVDNFEDQGSGGGIYINIWNHGQCIINKVLLCNCSSYEGGAEYYGGGMCAFISAENSILELIDVKFENCSSLYYQGGGIFIVVNSGAQLSIPQSFQFKNCKANYGGGCCLSSSFSQSIIQIKGEFRLDNCSAYCGGGMYLYIHNQTTIDINKMQFENCNAFQQGGGIFSDIDSNSQLIFSGQFSFINCQSNYFGGGIYSIIIGGGLLSIKNQSILTECKTSSGSGGGIFSNISYGTLNIEDTTFDRCTGSQPGNGGGISLIHKPSSIISITNSSFINCKTISSSSEQRYGWGGAIFIYTSIIATQLSSSNFLMRDLIFSGCQAVNSIGNNLHIQSINTYLTGQVIELQNLLSVNETVDLYYNNSYQQDYMGIDQSKIGDGTTINNNIPLFSFHALKFCIAYNIPFDCNCPIDDSNEYTLTQCEEDNTYHSQTKCNEDDGESVQTNTCICNVGFAPQGCTCPRDPDSLLGVPIQQCQCIGDDDLRQGLTCPITRNCTSGSQFMLPCLCSPEYSGAGCTCSWNVSQIQSGYQTKSSIQSVIDLPCYNYEIQLLDSEHSESVNISKQNASRQIQYFIKGRETNQEQTQTIWNIDCNTGRMIYLIYGVLTELKHVQEDQLQNQLQKDAYANQLKANKNVHVMVMMIRDKVQLVQQHEFALLEINQLSLAYVHLNILVQDVHGRDTSDGQAQTIQRTSQTSGWFSLTQAQQCNETSDSPETDECICKLNQSQQECACSEVGDLRNECSSISKTCDDPTVDLSNIPISRCSCISINDPRAGDFCPVISECSNDQINPKCLCTSEHQSPGCICTQNVHPQECICDQSSDALFPSNICSTTKTCSGSQGDDEQISQGQCTCGEGHHPYGCLCKDSEDIDCICPSNFGFICSCSWNFSQTSTEDNIKSSIQTVIDLTCDNYEIQLIDSEHSEFININNQANFLIKGRDISDGQAQTIWRANLNYGRIINQTYGNLTLERIDFRYNLAGINPSQLQQFCFGQDGYELKGIIDVYRANSVTINECSFKDINSSYSPVQISGCSSFSVNNCKFERLQSQEYYAGAVYLYEGLYVEISGNIFEECNGYYSGAIYLVLFDSQTITQIKINNNIINLCFGNYTGGINISSSIDVYINKSYNDVEIQDAEQYFKSFNSSGYFSLNQAIKTCTGGSAEEPTPKGCICQLSKTEQECACQEYDQRESCICLIVGDPRTHCIGLTIPSCEKATPEQLINLSTNICECYEFGDPRSECSQSKSCDDPSANMSNIPILLCECNGDSDPRAGITCPVTSECTNDQISPKCQCTSEHQSPGCICTQIVRPQDCICDNSSDALFPSNICSSTKTCSGSQGDDEQITQGQCTCGFGHHPSGCICQDENDTNCLCNIDFSPIGCQCPSNSEFICTCHWEERQPKDKIRQFGVTILIIGWFSLTQALPCNESSDYPETDECICKLNQSQQECACSEVGDLRNECSNITKACDDPSVDLSNIPIDRCSCISINDPRAGDFCPVINECTNDQTNPKCLCTQEHQGSGCICTLTVHPQECICDQSSDALFSQDICSSTKICTGPQGDDEQISQGQCTCGEGHHPIDCLCKDSDDSNCICPSNFGFICTCRWNVSQTSTEDNIKSSIQTVIHLTCDNYEIQLLDSEHSEFININNQANFLIKGRQTIGEQAQTIWSYNFNYGPIIQLTSGDLTLEKIDFQYNLTNKPTPEGCICKLSQTEQKCICQENDQRQSCVCLPVGDSRIHCIGHTTPCNQSDLTNISISICECRSTGDLRAGQSTPGISCPSYCTGPFSPNSDCVCDTESTEYPFAQCQSEQKCAAYSDQTVEVDTCRCSALNHPINCKCPINSTDLIGISQERCECLPNNDPRAGGICPITEECSIDIIEPSTRGCFCTEDYQEEGCTCTSQFHPTGCICSSSSDDNCVCSTIIPNNPTGCILKQCNLNSFPKVTDSSCECTFEFHPEGCTCNMKDKQQYPLEQTLGCLRSIPLTFTEKNTTIDLIVNYLSGYSQLDTSLNPPGPSIGYGNHSVDIIGGLEEINSSTKYTNTFDFYEDIMVLLNKLKDPSTIFIPPCVQKFSYQVADTRMHKNASDNSYYVTIDNDQYVVKYINWKGLPIFKNDGNELNEGTQLPLDAILQFADEEVSISRNPIARLNRALQRNLVQRNAQFFKHPESENITIQVVQPSGQNGIWNRSVKVRVSGDVNQLKDEQQLKIDRNLEEILRPKLLNNNSDIIAKSNQTLNSQSNVEFPSYQKFATFPATGTAEIIAFHVPDLDLGVLIITTFLTESKEQFSQAIFEIIDNFSSSSSGHKVNKLLIDIRGNYGGDVGIVRQTLNFLFPQAGFPIYQTVDQIKTPINEQIAKLTEYVTQLQSNVNDIAVDIETLQPKPSFYNSGNRQRTTTSSDGLKSITVNITDKFVQYMGNQDFYLNLTKDWNLKRKELFSPQNVLILTDGNCGGTCSQFVKHIGQKHLARIAGIGLPDPRNPNTRFDVSMGTLGGKCDVQRVQLFKGTQFDQYITVEKDKLPKNLYREGTQLLWSDRGGYGFTEQTKDYLMEYLIVDADFRVEREPYNDTNSDESLIQLYVEVIERLNEILNSEEQQPKKCLAWEVDVVGAEEDENCRGCSNGDQYAIFGYPCSTRGQTNDDESPSVGQIDTENCIFSHCKVGYYRKSVEISEGIFSEQCIKIPTGPNQQESDITPTYPNDVFSDNDICQCSSIYDETDGFPRTCTCTDEYHSNDYAEDPRQGLICPITSECTDDQINPKCLMRM
ncbi:MAG: hypothetical protein EZS28_002264 [Streblomastix strix]|uniref:Uncharacterized protein n=1 Tax=Streblomastix strix TaxID=222440 RepID=A0A5J4X5V2_9EUKA|nr:MAG: hypothetical protein EZS28_002264 [Streblomastix strix]